MDEPRGRVFVVRLASLAHHVLSEVEGRVSPDALIYANIDSMTEFAKPTSSSDEPNIAFLPNPGGVNVPVRYYGHENPGTPVLIIHGLQSHSGWFTQSADFISRLGMPVYCMDRHGSGLSHAPRGATRNFKQFIHDVDIAADYAMRIHDRHRVHVLGHCLGAIGAAAYACIRPWTLASLILTAPGLFTRIEPSWSHKLRIVWAKVTGASTRVPVPLAPWMFSELEEYVSFIRSDHLSLKDVTAIFYFEVLQARTFVRRHTKNLTMPVWMACAGKDPIVQNDRNRRFFDRIPSQQKKFTLYPTARHILEYSGEKKEFFGDIETWFRELGEAADGPYRGV